MWDIFVYVFSESQKLHMRLCLIFVFWIQKLYMRVFVYMCFLNPRNMRVFIFVFWIQKLYNYEIIVLKKYEDEVGEIC